MRIMIHLCVCIARHRSTIICFKLDQNNIKMLSQLVVNMVQRRLLAIFIGAFSLLIYDSSLSNAFTIRLLKIPGSKFYHFGVRYRRNIGKLYTLLFSIFLI